MLSFRDTGDSDTVPAGPRRRPGDTTRTRHTGLIPSADPRSHPRWATGKIVGMKAEKVGRLRSARELWELMSHYNWDDGYTVPLAVVRHPACDRGLALRLFWELDDTAQTFYVSSVEDFADMYGLTSPYPPDDPDIVIAYCEALTSGLRDGTFPSGANDFDTGFFGLDDPALTEQQRKRRASKTRLKQREFADQFLIPEPGR